MKYKKAQVYAIVPSGTDGYFKAILNVDHHGAAIVILGKDLTECVERTYIVLQAFNKGK